MWSQNEPLTFGVVLKIEVQIFRYCQKLRVIYQDSITYLFTILIFMLFPNASFLTYVWAAFSQHQSNKPAGDVPVRYAKLLGPCPSYSNACSWTCPALQAHQGPVKEGPQEPVSPKHSWQSKYLESFSNTSQKTNPLCFQKKFMKGKKLKKISQAKIIHLASQWAEHWQLYTRRELAPYLQITDLSLNEKCAWINFRLSWLNINICLRKAMVKCFTDWLKANLAKFTSLGKICNWIRLYSCISFVRYSKIIIW